MYKISGGGGIIKLTPSTTGGSCNHAQYQKNYRSHENMELKRALGLLKQIYRENLFSAVLSLIVIILLAVVGVMPSFLIGKIIDMAAAGRIDGLFMLNVGLILALGGGKILEIVQEYITAESSDTACRISPRFCPDSHAVSACISRSGKTAECRKMRSAVCGM